MKGLIILFVTIGILACNDSRTRQIGSFLKDKKGEIISFPDTFNVRILECDSIYPFSLSKQFVEDKSFRIVTLINGDCHACVTYLKEWNSIINKFNKTKVKFLFFIYAENYARFELMNKNDINFHYPVIYDYQKGYALKNKLPDDNLLNTMLIDSIGKIIVVGNPIRSKEILRLYEDAILKRHNKK